MIATLLLACRGEIALRFIRTARRLGIRTAVLHGAEEARAPFVLAADIRVSCDAANPYASPEILLGEARRIGADAVAPGYGPLAENADFAEACEAAGLIFVGPSPAAIRLTGDKVVARAAAERAGVPVVPGGTAHDAREAAAIADRIGYPVLIKAALGGGGRGIRLVPAQYGIARAWAEVAREAEAAFGRSDLYVERFLGERIRHVEVQLLGDRAGAVAALGDRGCSVQRRRQKVVEEAPCPALEPDLRATILDAAIRFAAEVGYDSAGTAEFLVDEGGAFHFIEMNARIQVEHPATEAVTGVDIVEEMLRVACGEPLRGDRATPVTFGHAIEFRICAEDPRLDFMPGGGTVTACRVPDGPGIRVDAGIAAGTVQPARYDSLCMKVVVWGRDREQALGRSAVALSELVVAGFPTNLPFHRWLLHHPAFRDGGYDLSIAGRFAVAEDECATSHRDMAVAAALSKRARPTEAPASAPGGRTQSGWRAANGEVGAHGW